MIYRRFGRTNQRVSLLSLGSGGPNQFGQAAGIPEQEIHKLVHRALDLGVNLFDTAGGYGASEEILGRALKGVPRDRYMISTKIRLDAPGTRLQGVAPPQLVIDQVESSLARLQVSEVDVLLVQHWPDFETYPRVRDQLIPVLHKLREQGKYRFLGASEISVCDGAHTWLQQGLQDNLYDVVMVAYNMINQSAERNVFPLCEKNDVGTEIIFAVRKVYKYPERLRQVIAELKRKTLISQEAVPDEDPLGWLVKGDVRSVISAAYRFCASHPAVSTVVSGTINLEHLVENVEDVGVPLPREDLQRLHEAFRMVNEPIGN